MFIEILEALSVPAESATQNAAGSTGNLAQQLSGLSTGTNFVHHTNNTPSMEIATTSSDTSGGTPHLQQGC